MKNTEEMEEKRQKANLLAKITLIANMVCTLYHCQLLSLNSF